MALENFYLAEEYHQNYLEKNPEVDVATWTNMNSSDILEKSGYVKSQN